MSPFTKIFAFISCCCSHNYRTSTGNSTDFPCFVNGYSPIIFYATHQDPFPAPTVKFAIKDLFPWAKIQLPLGYGDDDLSTHHLPFEMRIGVILARAIVVVFLLLAVLPLQMVQRLVAEHSFVSATYTALGFALKAVGVIVLFTGEAKRWYEARR